MSDCFIHLVKMILKHKDSCFAITAPKIVLNSSEPGGHVCKVFKAITTYI